MRVIFELIELACQGAESESIVKVARNYDAGDIVACSSIASIGKWPESAEAIIRAIIDFPRT